MHNPVRTILRVLLFLFSPVFFPLVAIRLAAQTAPNSDIVISTDRPSVANSSMVVPKGYLQFENGLLITDSQGQSVIDLPETSVRFGLLDKTELRFSAPDFFHTLNGATLSGFGDTTIGVKQQLGPLPDNFNLSVIFFLSLPTGANAISSHGYDPGVQLPWSRQLSKNWTANGQTAFYWPTVAGSHNFTGEATLDFDRQLTPACDAFIEYAGDFPENGGSRQILHFGGAYKLSARQQLDFQLAAGLSHAAPHVYFGFGYSFLLHVAK
jgi:hypothetical protein